MRKWAMEPPLSSSWVSTPYTNNSRVPSPVLSPWHMSSEPLIWNATSPNLSLPRSRWSVRLSLSLPGGEILAMAEPLLQRNFHPTVIVSGYCKALQKALEVCKQISRVIDIDNIKVSGKEKMGNTSVQLSLAQHLSMLRGILPLQLFLRLSLYSLEPRGHPYFTFPFFSLLLSRNLGRSWPLLSAQSSQLDGVSRWLKWWELCKVADWLTGWLIDWLIDCMCSWLLLLWVSDRLIHWLTDNLIDWLMICVGNWRHAVSAPCSVCPCICVLLSRLFIFSNQSAVAWSVCEHLSSLHEKVLTTGNG